MDKMKYSPIFGSILWKLGWGDLPHKAQEEVIHRMTCNHIGCMSDCVGVNLTEDEALKDIYTMEEDNIYLCLFIDDFYSLNDLWMHQEALNKKEDIKAYLLLGYSIKDAIDASYGG